jgi:hypothetical protein
VTVEEIQLVYRRHSLPSAALRLRAFPSHENSEARRQKEKEDCPRRRRKPLEAPDNLHTRAEIASLYSSSPWHAVTLGATIRSTAPLLCFLVALEVFA